MPFVIKAFTEVNGNVRQSKFMTSIFKKKYFQRFVSKNSADFDVRKL